MATSRCKGSWKIQFMAGKPLPQQQLYAMVGEMDFGRQLPSLPWPLSFLTRLSPLVNSSIFIVSIFIPALVTSKSLFPPSTSHIYLVLYLQPSPKHQPPSPKLNIFPHPEPALVLVVPSSVSGSPFFWHHL